MRRSIILPGLVTVFVALSPAATAFAAPSTSPGNPSGTGQPNQSLQSEPAAPPGLATGTNNGFNNVAVNQYANPTSKGGTSSGNSHVVSQYDVAAYQVSTHGANVPTK
jgi:hypothetical protein